MSDRPYNILYNNYSGHVVIQKNDRYISPSKQIISNLNGIEKKIENLSNLTNLNNIHLNNFEKKIKELCQRTQTIDAL